VVHLGDRDCSVQRRHQKLIEEAPAPALPESLRTGIALAALRLAKDVGYRSAGTVEFLVDVAADRFYFLEMNTRLQVEHGVTELVTGIDIVAEQIRIARGEALKFSQSEVKMHGHAMQARIAAEDPWEGFQPRPGKIDAMSVPQGPWLRLDFGVESGDTIASHYDSMFGKVQAWGPDRDSARVRLRAALAQLNVSGVATTAPYLAQVLDQPDFIAVTHDTGSAERSWRPDEATRPAIGTSQGGASSAAPVATSNERRVRLSTTQGSIEIAVFGPRREQRVVRAASGTTRLTDQKKPETEPVAPIGGAVVAVCVKAGEVVAKGAVLVVLEAMKMELPVVAPRAGTVEAVLVAIGDVTARGSLLVRLSTGDR
jgi:acetyl-CoA/propionyl-CoA carboxylase biotin carboxyl carrier protein